MSTTIADLIFERLSIVYGEGLALNDLLVKWWDEAGHTGFPTGAALDAAIDLGGAFSDDAFGFWTAFPAIDDPEQMYGYATYGQGTYGTTDIPPPPIAGEYGFGTYGADNYGGS